MGELGTELGDLFRDEATQRLDQMDALLLAVESGHAGAGSIGTLFRNVHTIKGAAGMLGLDDIREVAHATEDILARVRDSGTFPPGLAAPLLRATAALRAMVHGAGEPVGGVLRDLADSQASLDDGRPRGPAEEEAGVPAAAQEAGAAAQARDAGVAGGAGLAGGAEADGSAVADARAQQPLRVPAAKLDHLLDITAEIMEYRGRLTHKLGQQRQQPPQDVTDTLAAGGRLLGDLRDTAFGLRALPLSVITAPLPRMIRDVARTAGKDAELAVTGADTELDRVILESLPEPLNHLLRNAVVHGIEPPAERERAGKPARGRVELRAVPHGSMVEIVVADDGRGVSADALKAAGGEESLAGLLARPGYSTAAEVTELAGRGVGLDAVKAYAEALGGCVDIRSEPGHGAEVALLLPLGTVLTEVLLFERGGEVYGTPLSAVEEVVIVAGTLTLQGQRALEVRGRPLPVTDVAALLGAVAPPLGHRPPGIVVASGDRRAIVTCDALVGAEQVVVKSLGPVWAGLADYTGATVLGDGRIALLVAPAALTGGRGRALPAAGPEPATAPKILVVEDSFAVRELQRSILGAAGYPTAAARDGREALAVLSGDSEVALVITDIEMPGLDGIELTRAIRSDAVRSALPVVIVTAHGSSEDKRRGIEAGADAYMVKRGFDQQTLLATVERLVGR